MAVDVLKQMRERLAQETLRRQALEATPEMQATADSKAKVYAYTKPIPDDLWIKCPTCNGVMFRDDFEKTSRSVRSAAIITVLTAASASRRSSMKVLLSSLIPRWRAETRLSSKATRRN